MTCRFTILSQISEAPKILASAIAEIIRRKRFHEQFVKVNEHTSILSPTVLCVLNIHITSTHYTHT